MRQMWMKQPGGWLPVLHLVSVQCTESAGNSILYSAWRLVQRRLKRRRADQGLAAHAAHACPYCTAWVSCGSICAATRGNRCRSVRP